MLTRTQKEEIVAKLTDEIKESASCVLADFKGLTASEMVALKKELRAAGATFQVVKKTLLAIALKNNKIDLDPQPLEGQIAISVSQDEVSAAKILEGFAKKNENMKVVGGVLGTTVMSVEEVKELALLPSLDELRAQLVALLQSPARGMVGALQSPQQKFVGALEAMADGKSE